MFQASAYNHTVYFVVFLKIILICNLTVNESRFDDRVL